MPQTNDQEVTRKEALKELRKARKQTIEAATRRMKQQRKMIRTIEEQLGSGAKTVPEIAEGAGLETSEVMYCVAALKSYGKIVEGVKDGGYFRYQLSER